MALLILQISHALCAVQRPNMLFVLADDMGWGDVSYNKDYLQPAAGGANFIVNPPRTPNLDAVAGQKGTMRFDRFYSGSSVCSPTRSSVLSGRTPRRECIDNAEGCGQEPAWSCYDRLPFPAATYTVAQAAREKGYNTFFAGKWHLGDFWVKGESPTYAMKKWPSSNPGHHGFQEWHATEASAESSTPNCGCMPEWKNQGKGCITGTGEWVNDALTCTNYWRYETLPPPQACLDPNTTGRSCVANLTEKIEGDDSEYIVGLFDGFLQRNTDDTPWMAFLWLHTNHVPHYALPEWYHAYNDTMGNWAGNYLGTVSQMDHQIGVLQNMLAAKGLEDNTMWWFTADNGPHIDTGMGVRDGGQNSATNGLRQCKASLFEGGIRVPGFVRWPALIGDNFKQTNYTASTVDFLPTVLDILGMQYPSDWVVDGTSLLPLLNGSTPLQTHRTKPLGFGQSGQWAMLNSTPTATWKIVANPAKGQCPTMLPPFKEGEPGPFLFDLMNDPTESHDLCSEQADVCNEMKTMLMAFEASVKNSRVNESGCASPEAADTLSGTGVREGLQKGTRMTSANGCLGTIHVDGVELLSVGTCKNPTAGWEVSSFVNTYFGEGMCVVAPEDCAEDVPLRLVPCSEAAAPALLQYNKDTRLVESARCPKKCLADTRSSQVAQITTATVSLNHCSTYGLAFDVQQ